MVAAAIPPYDIIIFFAIWLISGISWFFTAWCRSKGTCCDRCAADGECCNFLYAKPPPPTSQGVADGEATTTTKVDIDENDDGENNKNKEGGAETDGEEGTTTDTKTWILRIMAVTVITFLIAFFSTVFLLLIVFLGAGMLDSMVFTPKAATACQSTACSVETKNGITGVWSEDCCSYSPSGLSTTDFFLKFKTSGTTTESAFVVHGWIMSNSTKHWNAPGAQKPLVILHSHGSGSNIGAGYRNERYKFLLDQASFGNVVLVAYDYPGYGKSTGSASVANVLESATGVAQFVEQYLSIVTDLTTLNLVAATTTGSTAQVPMGVSVAQPAVITVRANKQGADLSKVVLTCRSMGCAAATYLRKSSMVQPRAMVVQSTFTSVADLTKFYTPMMWWVLAGSADSKFENFSPLENIAGYSGCLYHSHSVDDEWNPFDMAEEIQSKAKATYSAACSTWVKINTNPGTIHTQPLTQIEKTTINEFFHKTGVRPT